MKNLLVLFLAFFTSICFAQHDHSGSLKNGQIAEISFHWIGRLVDTGKISESFLLNFQQLEVTPLPHHSAGEPAFQVNIKQNLGQENKQSELKIILDMKGKFLSHEVLVEVPTTQIEWPDSSVSELTEIAIHYLNEQTPLNINIVPFREKMKSLKIIQKINSDGIVQAIITIESMVSANKLEIVLSSSGEVQKIGLINL